MKAVVKIIMFICPVLLKGQLQYGELKAVSTCMRSLSNYSLKVNYRLYLDGKTSTPFQESFTEVKREEENKIYRQSEGTELLFNTDFIIHLDNHAREISILHRKKQIYEYLEDPLLREARRIDSLLNICKDLRVLSRSSTFTIYELILKPGESLKAVTISVTNKKKLPVKIHYRYANSVVIHERGNTPHKVDFEVTFENIYIGKSTNDAYAAEKYVAFKNGQMKPAAKYTGYTLTILN